MPAGIYAALHRNSFADRLTMLVSVAGFTMPSFVLALLLVLVFSVQLGWLPSSGSEGMANAILPIVTLGAAGAAILARFTRSAMLEVLGQPYIRAASAKGLSWRRVVTEHALPNAAIPTTTIIGFMVGTLIAGAVVVESVFAWPGIGRLLVVVGRQSRSRRRADDPAVGRRDHGDGQHHRRLPLRLARPAHAHGARDDRDRSLDARSSAAAARASSKPGRRSPWWRWPGSR